MFQSRQAIINSFRFRANRRHFLFIGSQQQSQLSTFGNKNVVHSQFIQRQQQRFDSSSSMAFVTPKDAKQQQQSQQSQSIQTSKDLLNPDKYEFFTPVTDLNESVLQKLGEQAGIGFLSPGVFPTPPFPVIGVIYGKNFRSMICLVSRQAGKPDAPAVNVWFMVHTGSPYTYLSEKSKKALFGDATALPSDFTLSIQDKNNQIACHTSRGTWKEANILGTNAMMELGTSIHFNFADRTIKLTN